MDEDEDKEDDVPWTDISWSKSMLTPSALLMNGQLAVFSYTERLQRGNKKGLMMGGFQGFLPSYYHRVYG